MAYNFHSDYKADNVNTEKKTIKKNAEYVNNVSDPNILNDFASYNALFTLSALTAGEAKDSRLIATRKAHDVIARSAGIGPSSATETNSYDEAGVDIGPINEILNKAGNKKLKAAVKESQKTLAQNRDIFIRNVTLNALPSLNSRRRLTSVTTITMELVEPAGITLLERIRGAAVNSGNLDHIDAPFLLTVEFKGFDELGRVASQEKANAMKRFVPIKIIDMQLDITAAGTVYSLKAIPWGEFGLVDTYNSLRTSGNLFPQGGTIRDAAVALERLMNKQNQDEKGQQADKPDIYRIVIDPEIKASQKINIKTLQEIGMTTTEVASGEEPVEFMRLVPGMSLSKILEELMKGHEEYSDKAYEEFKERCATGLGAIQEREGPQGVYDKAKDFYLEYFHIRSKIDLTGEFDSVRAKSQKLITYYVEPFKVHAYSLAIPGVSTGENFKKFVFKTYDYIFTGNNINILDLNINYRVAYFQSRLKDFESGDTKNTVIDNVKTKKTGGTTAEDIFCDPDFLLQSEPGIAKSEGTGGTGGGSPQLDSFLDALTNPMADMVNIRMEILGDPAWISQSQFIPMTTTGLFADVGVYQDPNKDFWRGNRDAIWNETLRCYNSDVAQPIIMLNFRMPTDINDKTGVYELQSSQSAEFSGLYRVIQVENNFSDGKFTSVLHLTRFNNQGVCVSDPVPTVSVVDRAGGMTEIVTADQARAILKHPFADAKVDLNSVKRRYTDLSNKIKGSIT